MSFKTEKHNTWSTNWILKLNIKKFVYLNNKKEIKKLLKVHLQFKNKCHQAFIKKKSDFLLCDLFDEKMQMWVI